MGLGGFEVELGGERHVFVNMHEREREKYLIDWWCGVVFLQREIRMKEIAMLECVRMCEVKT